MNGEVLHITLGEETGPQIVFIISKNTLHMHDIFPCFTTMKMCFITSLLRKKYNVLIQPLHFTDEELRSRQVKWPPPDSQRVLGRAGMQALWFPVLCLMPSPLGIDPCTLQPCLSPQRVGTGPLRCPVMRPDLSELGLVRTAPQLLLGAHNLSLVMGKHRTAPGWGFFKTAKEEIWHLEAMYVPGRDPAPEGKQDTAGTAVQFGWDVWTGQNCRANVDFLPWLHGLYHD